MSTANLSDELRSDLEAAAERAGCELLAVERHGDTLRVVLDHPQGVTLAHCEQVSKEASALLDVADYGGRRYVLEVSSPGLDRPLYRPADYQRFAGHRVRITRRDPTSGRKMTLRGMLEAFRPAGPGIAVLHEAEKDERYEIPLTEIEAARLEIEL
ncbi:MAG: ribosome maturation factor RimP [Thermoanaerobaculia bacterium]